MENEMQGIEIILAAMSRHGAESAVQVAGCGALRNLANHKENTTSNSVRRAYVKIAHLGGIEAILAAMRNHIADSAVQAAGCGALQDLAHHEPTDNNLLNRLKI